MTSRPTCSRVALAVTVALACLGPEQLRAQSSFVTQSTPGSSPTDHRTPLGKPCLNTEAAAIVRPITPELYDHVVSIANGCMMPIHVKVCYYKTDACQSVQVPAYGRLDATLGTSPAKQFRISLKEGP